MTGSPQAAAADAGDNLAMARAFPALRTALPRAHLTRLPTRVHRLTQLAATLGGAELWIKRDDECGILYGGNKPRKLEFLLGDALARGKRTVITSGGIGTHHGLATAICARSLGLRTILLLLKQPLTEHVRRCLLLDYAAGAELVYGASIASLAVRGLGVCARELLRGELPYIIPTGGTSARGTVGYVNAAFELHEQIAAGELPEPDWIFVPMGSGGTVAGLVLGAALAGLRSRVVAVLVSDIFPPSAMQLARLATRTLVGLRRHAPSLPQVTVSPKAIRIVDEYVGPGYGTPTEAGRSARDALAALEDIRLETTYTAKCLAAVLDAVRGGTYPGRILFWNTYSSVDPAAHLGPLPDFHRLPPRLQRFFSGPALAA